MNDVLEKLAELEHEQWCSWVTSISSTETLSPARLERWKKCLVPYEKLTEEMKNHDREWARKVLQIVTPNGIEGA